MIRSAAVPRGIPRFGDTEISPIQGLMCNPLPREEVGTIFTRQELRTRSAMGGKTEFGHSRISLPGKD